MTTTFENTLILDRATNLLGSVALLAGMLIGVAALIAQSI